MLQNGFKCISCLCSWLGAAAHCGCSITREHHTSLLAQEKIKIQNSKTVSTEFVSLFHPQKVEKSLNWMINKSGTVCIVIALLVNHQDECFQHLVKRTYEVFQLQSSSKSSNGTVSGQSCSNGFKISWEDSVFRLKNHKDL